MITDGPKRSRFSSVQHNLMHPVTKLQRQTKSWLNWLTLAVNLTEIPPVGYCDKSRPRKSIQRENKTALQPNVTRHSRHPWRLCCCARAAPKEVSALASKGDADYDSAVANTQIPLVVWQVDSLSRSGGDNKTNYSIMGIIPLFQCEAGVVDRCKLAG